MSILIFLIYSKNLLNIFIGNIIILELINENYGDCYFSIDDGYLESKYVFVDGNSIETRLLNPIKIGETGFGTGLNLLVLEDLIYSLGYEKKEITFTTVEKFILEPSVVEKTLSLLNEVTNLSLSRHISLYNLIYSGIKTGWNKFVINREWGTLTINLFYGDVIESFNNYPVKNDAWFLDGHSPDKNPEMWSELLFESVAKYSISGTTFATFTAAGIVKRGLRNAGFSVRRIKGFGRKRHMILGALIKDYKI